MLIEVHVLQNLSASNPNRDNNNVPKTSYLGGKLRGRISSQCIKRSIRTSQIFRDELGDNLGIRTKSFPELVGEKLKEHAEITDVERAAIVNRCMNLGKSSSKEKDDKDAKENGEDNTPNLGKTAQLIYISHDHADEFVTRLLRLREASPASYREYCSPSKKKKSEKTEQSDKAEKVPPLKKFEEELYAPLKINSVDIALFGRMTTSDAFDDIEAAVEVAHAISTNQLIQEVDWWTAVDDIASNDTTNTKGSGHLGDRYFNSNTYYKYFSIDVDGLVSRIPGKTADAAAKLQAKQLAVKAIKALLKASWFVLPTGSKKGFANNNLPSAIMVEIKECNIPTNYANAFIRPATSTADCDLIEDSINKLGQYVGCLDVSSGIKVDRIWHAVRGEELRFVRPGDKTNKHESVQHVPTKSIDSIIRVVADLVQDHIG